MHNMRIDFGMISVMPVGFYKANSSLDPKTITMEPGALIGLSVHRLVPLELGLDRGLVLEHDHPHRAGVLHVLVQPLGLTRNGVMLDELPSLP